MWRTLTGTSSKSNAARGYLLLAQGIILWGMSEMRWFATFRDLLHMCAFMAVVVAVVAILCLLSSLVQAALMQLERNKGKD